MKEAFIICGHVHREIYLLSANLLLLMNGWGQPRGAGPAGSSGCARRFGQPFCSAAVFHLLHACAHTEQWEAFTQAEQDCRYLFYIMNEATNDRFLLSPCQEEEKLDFHFPVPPCMPPCLHMCAAFGCV